MSKKYNKDYFKNLREQSERIYYGVSALNWGQLVEGEYKVVDRYNFNWRYSAGDKKTLTPLPCDLGQYIKNFQDKCFMEGKSVSAYVGTDSQNHMAFTRFVTVICLQVERNGVHVLVSKMDLPKIYDYRVKLLRETDITAEFIRNNKHHFSNINMSLEVHADYNAQTNHKSNGVVTEATNFMKVHGFNLGIKGSSIGSWSASYAADYFC